MSTKFIENTTQSDLSNSQIDTIQKWFDDFIATLLCHQDMLITNTARDDLKDLYDKLIFGTNEDITYNTITKSASRFISKMLIDYLKDLSEQKIKPVKIAVDLSGFHKLLLWIIIKNDDEKTLDELILTEARINAKYYKYNFSFSSMIVEESDKIDIPPHYKILFPSK